MKHYCDITLLPDAEISTGFIWQRLYRQIHLALVNAQAVNGQSLVGVSFPEYGNQYYPLGAKLRLLAAEERQIAALGLAKQLQGLSDYVHVTSIKAVPDNVSQYACFKRIQFQTNSERLARRRAKRKKESIEQARAHYQSYLSTESKLPFINMNSHSNNEKFRLFIERSISGKPNEGEFSCYGLTNTATVPWF